MVQKGYDMRGGEDCKQSVVKFMANPHNEVPGVINHNIYDEWIKTIVDVLRLKLPDKSTEKSYDPKRVIRSAIRQFGLTHDLNSAGFILPNGGLLNLSGTGHGRDLDHREIADVYSRLGIEIEADTCSSSTPYMLAFMKDCRVIRIGGSQNHVDIRTMPTRQQAEQLIKFFSMYDGDIYLDVENDKYGRASNAYTTGTNPSRILRDIITFFNTGNLPPVPITKDPALR